MGASRIERSAVSVGNYRRSESARVSLVDHASFALMRSLGIGRAFAFDDDFAHEGFELIT